MAKFGKIIKFQSNTLRYYIPCHPKCSSVFALSLTVSERTTFSEIKAKLAILIFFYSYGALTY